MFDIQENLKKLPETPGVYLHKDRLGQVIYVGKAVNLKNRVRQYFQSSYQNSNPKVRAMVSHIAEFEYIRCGSEMEALILECNLIKKYQPRYNVLLRDDKTYPYIMVTTSEEFPRVVKTRVIRKDGNRYFGPFSDVGAVNQIVDLLPSIFRLKRCPALTFRKNHRPCLNYYINACRGICLGGCDKEEYDRDVQQILQFLSGKDRPLIRTLTEKMEAASDAMNYEEAAKWRDAIQALEALKETQRVTMVRDQDLDMVLAVKDQENSFVVLFQVREGKLSGRETFSIQTDETDSRRSMISEFIKQYYSQWAVVPPEILVEEEPEEKELLEEFLSRGPHKVKIDVPKRGDRRALLSMARQDVTEMTRTISERQAERDAREKTVQGEMESVIRDAGYSRRPEREGLPVRVESYDISNTNGVDSVGVMVVFRGLSPIKKDYRRFKIRTIEGPNDVGSLQEVLYRRYRRVKNGDETAVPVPDLILMDGGQGQVNAAKKVLDALGLPIPVVGMAKDDRHRTRALVFSDGREIDLKNRLTLYQYTGTVQEEVHRFAIAYHHKLHGKRAIRSMLDNIEGVGEKRRNELLYHFKTIDRIRDASVPELTEVPSITEAVAENIYRYFHPDRTEKEIPKN
ncbi:MAG: excinuclease ABC subunit UvrC [Anaerovoracaceae bacterium]|jgi:excinuclease ABC subunit C